MCKNGEKIRFLDGKGGAVEVYNWFARAGHVRIKPKNTKNTRQIFECKTAGNLMGFKSRGFHL